MPEHIDFNALVQKVKTIKTGRTDTISLTVEAGKKVKLEVSPNGEEVGSGIVPEGKVWDWEMTFAIVERDA